MESKTASKHYTIIYPDNTKSEKVEFTTDLVDAETINKIVGYKYELIPTKSDKYCIAENGLILIGRAGQADHLPFNKKATHKTDGSFCYQVQGTAVYIKLKYLKYIAGDKRQLMSEYLKHSYADGSPKI